jgi:hypothetical protein
MGRVLIAISTVLLFTAQARQQLVVALPPIAAAFPHDLRIESSPDVLFVESFEEATLSELRANWTDSRLNFSTFSTDVPAGSPKGSHSIALERVGPQGGDHLYKRIPGQSLVYTRAYFKYSGRAGEDHPDHSGIWMGGYNPPLDAPDPGAGGRAKGDDKFIAAFEMADDTGRMETYNYYAGQHANFGDWLLNTPGMVLPFNTWFCLEMMVKVNTPPSRSNGEQRVWVNGVEKGYWGEGFPRGAWSYDIWFKPGAGSTPFHGFRWRTVPELDINWVWFQNYTGTDALSKTIRLDHVVVAKRRIGCLS